MSLREHEVTVQFESTEATETVEKGPRDANPNKRRTQYLQVEPGIYQDQKTNEYFERPRIGGKRTWRPLKGKNIKLSREEHRRRKAAIERGEDPYAEAGQDMNPGDETIPHASPKTAVARNPLRNKAEGPGKIVQFPGTDGTRAEEKKAEVKRVDSGRPQKRALVEQARIVGEVIRKYMDDGYLDKHLLPRPESTREDEERHCKLLLEFWEFVEIVEVADMICDEYRDWRLKNIQQGEGLRTVDRELNTLHNAFRYGKRRGIVKVNSLADRPKYQPSSRVHHCREFMPTDANDLHAMLSRMALNRHSAVLLFQACAEAYSGLRTCEVLMWKAYAKPGEFGYVTPDGKSMLVWRCKGQHLVNPFIRINEGMAALLKVHKAWHDTVPDVVAVQQCHAATISPVKSFGIRSKPIAPAENPAVSLPLSASQRTTTGISLFGFFMTDCTGFRRRGSGLWLNTKRNSVRSREFVPQTCAWENASCRKYRSLLPAIDRGRRWSIPGSGRTSAEVLQRRGAGSRLGRTGQRATSHRTRVEGRKRGWSRN